MFVRAVFFQGPGAMDILAAGIGFIHPFSKALHSWLVCSSTKNRSRPAYTDRPSMRRYPGSRIAPDKGIAFFQIDQLPAKGELNRLDRRTLARQLHTDGTEIIHRTFSIGYIQVKENLPWLIFAESLNEYALSIG